MAAATVGALLNIRKETIRQSLEHFQSVEHRLEFVLKINNVAYINDSKATNVNAVYYALDSMQSPTVWIAGGQDKGNQYEELLPLVNEKVKAIICLGSDNDKIIQCFGSVVDMLVETQAMEDAVQVAYRLAERGDTVLLSPACASFDLFKNYKDLTLAMLTGFMIGSLNKIWPWKKILTWRVNSKGLSVPLTEQSILPTNVEGDNQLALALVLITIGFVVILLLEKFGPENEK